MTTLPLLENPLYAPNRECVACPMVKECAGPVPAEGNLGAKLALIGEAPGRNEDKLGRPWMGAAGSFLNSLLWAIGIQREDVWLTNMGKCRPRNNRTPTPEEAAFCASKWLDVELGILKPRVIGLLGDTAISYFLGEGAVYERHGRPVLQEGIDAPILLPMYHPAAALYDKGEGMLARVMDDFKVLKELVEGTWEPVVDTIQEVHYWDAGMIAEVDTNEDQPTTWGGGGGLDTEWVDGKLWSVQVSTEPGEGLFLPAEREVKLTAPVTVHNYMADGKYIDLPPGTKDTMVMAYLLGLPQGLKELAKTFCGMEMDSYRDMTRQYGKDKAIKYLEDALALHPDKPPTKAQRDKAEKKGEELVLNMWPESPVIEDAIWVKKSQTLELKSKTPQHIATYMRKILADVSSGKELKDGPVDPYSRWNSIDASTRFGVEEVFGPMPDGNLEDAPREAAVHYSVRDADATGRVESVLWPRILAEGLLPVFLMDMGTLPIALEMEKNGIRINKGKLEALGLEFLEELQEKSEEIFQLLDLPCPCGEAGCLKRFNPNSNTELATLFFTDLGFIPTKYTKTGLPSVAKAELSKINHPVVKKIEEYRHIQHLKDSFCDTLPPKADENSRVHPTIKTTRTSTGRWSMEDPNPMQIPVRTERGRRIKEAFESEIEESMDIDNVLVSIDYSQIELRIAAHLCNSPEFKQVFIDGRDPHKERAVRMYGITADEVTFEQRRAMKAVGFGDMYGITAQGLYDDIQQDEGMKHWTLEDCQTLLENSSKLYPEQWVWKEETKAFARRNGYVTDLSGRRRNIPESMVPIDWIRSQGDRQAINMPIQGGAQAVLKWAMNAIWRWMHENPLVSLGVEVEPTDPGVTKQIKGHHFNLLEDVKWLLQVHDELVWEMPRVLAPWFCSVVGPMMANVVKLSVPLEVEAKIGPNWRDMEKV